MRKFRRAIRSSIIWWISVIKLNGNVEKAVDMVLLVRFIIKEWGNLSESSRYQLMLILEDRAGNLAASVKGWRDMARAREQAITKEAQHIIQETFDSETDLD